MLGYIFITLGHPDDSIRVTSITYIFVFALCLIYERFLTAGTKGVA